MASGINSNNIAALDIGTNSFHMVVAKVVDQGFEVIAREKESVRIGHGAGEMKELSLESMDRGIAWAPTGKGTTAWLGPSQGNELRHGLVPHRDMSHGVAWPRTGSGC